MCRVLGTCDARIDRDVWTPPGLFRLLVRGGDLERDEAFRAFNMGIGMVLVVDAEEREPVLAHLRSCGEEARVLGHTVEGEGLVRWCDGEGPGP